MFVQRFFEFVHATQNVAEIHDFVHKLMKSNFIQDKAAKLQLVKNLMQCFHGLEGVEDELSLISILTIILQRLMPEESELVSMQNTND